MSDLRFAILGTGFWARYQLAAWKEIPGVQCVALYNRTRIKAEALAYEFDVPVVHDDPEALIRESKPDFLDVITSAESHGRFVRLAARHRIPVICQKPMASFLNEARTLVAVCRRASVPFLIHENWRWQKPIRELRRILDSGIVGRVFRARIDYVNSFPVFENQPTLKEVDRFILTDIGAHIFDTTRFLFGEATRLHCETDRVHADIRGEDVATVIARTTSGAIVTCNLSYASRVEHDRFPETYAFVEGDKGSIELGPDCWIRVTTDQGTVSRRHPPAFHSWADPRYLLVQSSIVDCNANLLQGLQGGTAETTAADNLRTLEWVHAAYASARTGRTVPLPRHPNTRLPVTTGGP